VVNTTTTVVGMQTNDIFVYCLHYKG
jgi:hypothetical protein